MALARHGAGTVSVDCPFKLFAQPGWYCLEAHGTGKRLIEAVEAAQWPFACGYRHARNGGKYSAMEVAV